MTTFMTTIPVEYCDHKSDERLISLIIVHFESLRYEMMVKNPLNEGFFLQKIYYEISIFQITKFQHSISNLQFRFSLTVC